MFPQLKRVNAKPKQIMYEDPKIIIENGLSTVNRTLLSSNTCTNNQISFNIVPSDKQTAVSRKFYVRYRVRGTVSAPDRGYTLSELLSNGSFAPRSFPLAKCSTNTTVNLGNGATFSLQGSDLMAALERIELSEYLTETDLSLFPSIPDQSQLYSDLLNSNRNPLIQYADTSAFKASRGGNAFINVISSSNTALVFDLIATEPIMCNGLMAHDDTYAFAHLLNIQVQIQLDGVLTRMMSYVGTDAFSTFTMAIQTAELLFNSYTLDSVSRLPPVLEIPYKNYSAPFYTNIGSTSAGATFSVQTNNIQLSNIPSKFYVAVVRKNPTYTQTDTFARIDSINVNIFNRGSNLAGMSVQGIFQMSNLNGIVGSWEMYNRRVGSVVCMSLAGDLPASDPSVCANVQGISTNFSIVVGGTNLSSVTEDLQVLVFWDIEMILTLSAQGSIQTSDYLTRLECLESNNLPAIELSSSGFNGGSFWSDFAKGFKKGFMGVHDFVKGNKLVSGITGALSPVLPELAPVSKVASQLGYGVSGGKRLTARDFRR